MTEKLTQIMTEIKTEMTERTKIIGGMTKIDSND